MTVGGSDSDYKYNHKMLIFNCSQEEEKRKKLREQMRKEEDMKQRMRMEKMKGQKAKEEQIRENLLAEEESIMNSLKESGYHSIPTQRENRRPVSMPALLPVSIPDRPVKPVKHVVNSECILVHYREGQ